MTTTITYADFEKAVLNNNFSRCQEIITTILSSETLSYVNLLDKKGRTLVYLASHEQVGPNIWEILLPYANENTLYRTFRNPITSILVPESTGDNKNRYGTKLHQLKKIRLWLDFTKCTQSYTVKNYRSLLLCDLCRVKCIEDTSFASESDVESLCRDIIEQYNTDVNALETNFGEYPLHVAIKTRNLNLLCLFLSCKADTNCRDDLNRTPLHLAGFYLKHCENRLEMINYLVFNKSCLSAEHLYESCSSAFTSVTMCLLPDELDVFLALHPNAIQSSLNSQLPFPSGHSLMLNLIVDSINRNSRNYGQPDLLAKISILQKHGLKLDLTDIHGRSLLHYACWFRFTDVVAFLLHKVDPYRRDSFGRGCAYYAISYPSEYFKEMCDQNSDLSSLKLLEENLDRRRLFKMDNCGMTMQNLAMSEKNSIALEYFSPTKMKSKMVDSCYFKPYTNYTLSFKRYILPENVRSLKLVQMLLNDPNIGPLVKNTITTIAEQAVTRFVHKLANKLNENDCIFNSQIQLAGSFSEGTKTNPPDEFDFQFHLNVLSIYVGIEYLDKLNNVYLTYKKSKNEDIVIIDLLHNKETLNLGIYHAFNSAVYKVLQEKAFWEDLPFYWCFCHSLGNPWPKSLVAPLHLKLIGDVHTDIDISIDLVPVIIVENSELSSTIKKLIPVEVTNFVKDMNFNWHVICRNAKYARLSFLPVERWILCRLMTEIREAYIISKCIRNFAMKVTDYEPEYITSYMLKNALFYELDPNTTYSLLNSQLLSCGMFCPIQKLLLKMMRQNYSYRCYDKTVFIKNWTMRIFQRLEKMFKTQDSVSMYCRPSVYIPEITIVRDEQKQHPYLKALKTLINLLTENKDNEVFVRSKHTTC